MQIQTLIELYDERPLENILGVEVFRPERVVYLFSGDNSRRKVIRRQLQKYFAHRGLSPEIVLARADMYDTASLLRQFRRILGQYPGCVMDITGGTDDLLFAAGLVSAESKVPVFTYSRTRNMFYSIRNASFANRLPCDIRFSVEDCFLMAGGTMRRGRVDNGILKNYLQDMDPFFSVFLKHRSRWDKIVSYMQRIAPSREDGSFDLSIEGPWSVKGEHGSLLHAPEEALEDLRDIHFLEDLKLKPRESVSFRFRDGQIRTWLRDVGSVLELYVYKACIDSGLFHDVRTSAVVDWDTEESGPLVSNELDVMCTRGITPVFISCKTCAIKTEALNELSVLRDRFGGKMAQAAIVTAEPAGGAARNRAAELNIRVIDLNDLSSGAIFHRLHELIRS